MIRKKGGAWGKGKELPPVHCGTTMIGAKGKSRGEPIFSLPHRRKRGGKAHSSWKKEGIVFMENHRQKAEGKEEAAQRVFYYRYVRTGEGRKKRSKSRKKRKAVLKGDATPAILLFLPQQAQG